MTIRNPYASQLAQAQTSGSGETRRAGAGSDGPVSPVAPVTPQSGSSDSVELSEAVRAQQAKDAARAAEVETARSALAELPGLSDERLAELQQRVADGYYDRPEVVAATAAQVARSFGAE